MASRNPLNDTSNTWISGDGGPLIVLQSGALPHWRGALDFSESRMNGGLLETDYDLICSCDDHHLYRHGRDMLVLYDSESSGRMFHVGDEMIVVEQPYYDISEESTDVIEEIATTQPHNSFRLTIVDNRLRLLVGADDGDGSLYGFAETEVTPGLKQCDVYHLERGLIIMMQAVRDSTHQDSSNKYL